MAQVTVKFGMDSVSKHYNNTSEILSDNGLASFLGFDSSRVETYVNGSQYNGVLDDGDVVVLNTKANTKG